MWLVMMSKKTLMPRLCALPMSVLEVGVGAQVRVDLGEVGDPVAVVAGRLGAGVPWTGLFLNEGVIQIAVVPRSSM